MQTKILILTGFIALATAGYMVRRHTAPTSESAPEQNKTIVTDQRGKRVAIPKNVERIVTLPMPAPSLLFALDGTADRIVGMHPSSLAVTTEGILGTIAPELKSAKADFVQGGFQPNVEELLKLRPDVVFQWADKGEDILAPMERAGIPVIGLTYGTQEDLEAWMRIMGDVLEKKERAEEFIRFHQSALQTIKEKVSEIPDSQKPKVLYLPYGAELKTTGSGTYNDLYFDWTGALNVAHDLAGWQTVTMEQIVSWNPDIIYIGNFSTLMPEEILSDAIDGQYWSSISAVKNRRVYKIPLGAYRWDPPNQESPLMWQWLLSIQHPEIGFSGTLRGNIRDFYAQFYGYSLSNGEIDSILVCESNNKTLPWCRNN